MSRGQRAQLCIGMAMVGSLWLHAAVAAPDRLDNKLPDAFPDTPGDFAVSLGHEWLDLDGALGSASTNHDYFRLRYQFNPDVAGSIGYQHHALGGAEGLLSPLFDNRDSANIWSFDLSLNLLDTPETAANADTKQEYVGASAFNIGVAADLYDTSSGAVSDSTTLLKAYLAYSTDLTEDIRAHTYFSSGRLSGAGRSGSVNTVAAGLDYELAKGDHPLTLMANGILDIYNFRDPAFDTSRVSRFDLGLRYRFSPGWYGQVGWMTVNDSASDASGSGLFANVNWTGEGHSDDCGGCEMCKPTVPAEPAATAPVAAAPSGNQVATAVEAEENYIAAGTQEPASRPALAYPGDDIEAGLRGTETLMAKNATDDDDTADPPLALYASAAPAEPAQTQPSSARQERTVSTAPSEPRIKPSMPELLARIDEPSTAAAAADVHETIPATESEPSNDTVPVEPSAPAATGEPAQIAAEPLAQADASVQNHGAVPENTPPVVNEAASTHSGQQSSSEGETTKHYPVLLEPGKNFEVTKLDSETIQKVQLARESVDKIQVAPQTVSLAEPEAEQLPTADEKSQPAQTEAITSGPQEQSAPRVASRSRFDFPQEALLSEVEEQSAIKPQKAVSSPAKSEPLPKTDKKLAAADATEQPTVPEPMEHKPLLALTPPVPAAVAQEDESVTIALPVEKWSEAQPAIEPAYDKSKEASAIASDRMPLASETAAEIKPITSATPVAPAATPPSKPTHVRPGSRMARPPVSETARKGLAMLMTFMLPASDTAGPTESEEPGAEPAVQPGTDNKIQLSSVEKKSDEG